MPCDDAGLRPGFGWGLKDVTLNRHCPAVAILPHGTFFGQIMQVGFNFAPVNWAQRATPPAPETFIAQFAVTPNFGRALIAAKFPLNDNITRVASLRRSGLRQVLIQPSNPKAQASPRGFFTC
jgi:hypothetical protein